MRTQYHPIHAIQPHIELTLIRFLFNSDVGIRVVSVAAHYNVVPLALYALD